MKIEEADLIRILNEAFDSGQNSPYDFRTEAVDEVFAGLKVVVPAPKVLSFADIKLLQDGTSIWHPTLGKGVVKSEGVEKLVEFDGCQMFVQDASFPWDKPSSLSPPEKS